MIAEIVVSLPGRSLDKVFHYNVPPALEEIDIGARVEVPFGFRNKCCEGFVVGLPDESDRDDLKDVARILSDAPAFDSRGLELAQWVRQHCLCTLNEALHLLIPPRSGNKYVECLLLCEGTAADTKALSRSRKQRALVETLIEGGGEMKLTTLKEKGFSRSVVNALVQKGLATLHNRASRDAAEKYKRVAYIPSDVDSDAAIEDLSVAHPVQAQVLELLAQCEMLSVPDIMQFAGCSRGVADGLYAKGLIDYKNIRVMRRPTKHLDIERTQPLSPTPEQGRALERILTAVTAKKRETFLLHGITGSGKTEVFLQAISHALKMGKQAIVLVPEISLTPQMVSRFLGRLGDEVAILHSALSLGERLDEWSRIKSGAARIVVGARSAIFAPFDNIGLIVVDEEHESAYKSGMSPRYHAREVALERARQHGAVTLLASATPSIESYYAALNGEYTLLEMEKRFNQASLPAVQIVDMREQLSQGNRSMFSRQLTDELAYNLKAGEQTILFLNRRGFSTFVSCRACGFAAECAHCSISLTYHKFTDTLVCHYCGHTQKNLSKCPQCDSGYIRYFGTGTQRVEEELRNIFPDISILRMDMDTTGQKQSHERILGQFERERVDVLLGTQMVAKGLDFPDITLVGVLAADMALNTDDYRAAERAFGLITQVCGRAGRGDRPGRAVIQTYAPDNPTILQAQKQDYISFYRQEIKYREALTYPPFCDIVLLLVIGSEPSAAMAAANRLGAQIKMALAMEGEHYEIFGPTLAPISKIKDKFRYRLWFKCRVSDEILEQISQAVSLHYSRDKQGIIVTADVNPASMN